MAEVYLQTGVGPNDVRRSDLADQATWGDYWQQDATLGVEFFPLQWLSFFVGGNYSHVSGNQNVFGSFRHQGALQTGFKLHEGPFFLGLKGGLGVNRTHFNFGGGTILPTNINLSAVAAIETGLEYCVSGRNCIGIVGSPFFESVVIGNPRFYNYGVLVGPIVHFDLTPGVKEVHHERIVRVPSVRRDTEEVCQKTGMTEGLTERVQGLETEVTRLQAENQRLEGVESRSEEIEPLQREVVHLEGELEESRSREAYLQSRKGVATTIAKHPILAPIFFPSGIADVSLVNTGLPDTPVRRNPQLDRVIEYLNQPENQAMRIRIHGYANEKGAKSFNEWLAQKRAELVMDYLRSHGIPEERMEAEGHGSEDSLLPDSSDKSNRRVEFEVIP